MDEKFTDVILEKEENHILPFLWLHGENEVILREEIARIHESKIRAFCVESRPHPDFCGPKWFEDLEIVMNEATKRKMKVWLFDDSHFPTGLANGLVKSKYPQYLKYYMDYRSIAVAGPMAGASFLVSSLLFPNEELITAVAVSSDGNERMNVTENIREGILFFDVPQGQWDLYFIIKTRNGGEKKTEDYLNPVIAEATAVLIEAVYEPHYQHLKKYFGNTFAGFFSDEPRFGNTDKYHAQIGTKMPLPWRDDLLALLSEAHGQEFQAFLPDLWKETGKDTAGARFTYMNVITTLYAKNFTAVLADWCHAHQVEYIGHLIEDKNSHSCLGVSAGHYFRALGGQDMAGVDVVLRQIIPGMEHLKEINLRNEYLDIEFGEASFYHYLLAKLGSSLAHLDKTKKGRAFCEVYGAYGWSTGLKQMKWISDHMLVRGINNFVPHAFSPKDFPDFDCPPHFYARGHNPQYKYFNYLMGYLNRISALFSDGLHHAPAAVLYNAESQWYSPCEDLNDLAKTLTRTQIDFDLVWCDILDERAEIIEETLHVNGERFHCLIIQKCKALPGRTVRWLADACAKGFKIFFIDSVPTDLCEAEEKKRKECTGDSESRGIDEIAMATADPLKFLAAHSSCISCAQIPKTLHQLDMHDIQAKTPEPNLCYYHYSRSGTDYYMLFNEHPTEIIVNEINFRTDKIPCFYDALENRRWNQQHTRQHGWCEVPVRLYPYESLILCFEEDAVTAPPRLSPDWIKSQDLDRPWQIHTRTAENPDDLTVYESCELANLNTPGKLPGFSGQIRYETTFEWDGSSVFLDLGEAYETVELKVNGKFSGVRICPPYHFDISDAVVCGTNHLSVDVTNTLANHLKDFISAFGAIEPTGLIGPVKLRRKME